MTDILHKINRNHRPFKVPEGYFADFTTRLMAQIPEAATVAPVALQCKAGGYPRPGFTPASRIVRFIPWLGTASVAALVALFAQINIPATYDKGDVMPELSLQTSTMTSEEAAEADALYDYMMLDNSNLVSYASDNSSY